MLPILAQNVITNFVNLLDNIMVGQIGTEQMSGVAIINQLLFVVNLCIFGSHEGAGILTAQYYGKKDIIGVQNTHKIKLIIALSVTLCGIAILFFFPSPLIHAFLHESSTGLDLAYTYECAQEYLMIMLIGLIPFALKDSYSSTLRECSLTFVPMIASISAIFVNLFFNYILIFGKLGLPALGVKGAAIATVISRFAEFLIVALWAHLHPERCEFVQDLYQDFHIPKQQIIAVIKMGLPLLLNEMLWSMGQTTLTQCYSVRGLEVISAYNIANTVNSLFSCAEFAMGESISIIIGHLLGDNRLQQAKQEDSQIIFTSLCLCSVVSLIMISLSGIIPLLYSTTTEVRQLAKGLLIIFAAIMPIDAMSQCGYFTLRTGGKTSIMFLFDSGFIWTIYVPLAFYISRFTKIPIIPFMLMIKGFEILKATLGLLLVKKGIWVNNLVK